MQLKKRKSHNALWSDCPNKDVFSDRLNQEYDNSAVCKSAGKLFHTIVAAAAQVLLLSLKQLEVRWTVTVLVSAERLGMICDEQFSLTLVPV